MNGQDPALTEIRGRFTALKTLSGLQAQLLAAFQEKNKADQLKYGDIGRNHGGASWAEIYRFAEGNSACCGGRTFQTIISYTGQTELGEKITACVQALPGDTWRGLSTFDTATLDSLFMIWEAYARDAKGLRFEGFSQIFPEEMRQAVFGALIRKREDASYFASQKAQSELFEFLAGDAYGIALKKGFEDLTAERMQRADAWKEPIAKLEQLYVGRAAQAQALGVHPGTLNNLLHGTTAPEVHANVLKKALALITGTEEPPVAQAVAEPLSKEEEDVLARLSAAQQRDPSTYSYSKMAERMRLSRRSLSRIVHRETAMPEGFVSQAKAHLPELFTPSEGAPTVPLAPKPEAAEAPTEERPPLSMAEALVEATASIGLNAVKSGVRALEDWQEATDSQLRFTPKQRDDMARLAARLIRLSGLTPSEASLAITGEPVTMEELRGVFGGIHLEDRRKH